MKGEQENKGEKRKEENNERKGRKLENEKEAYYFMKPEMKCNTMKTYPWSKI